MDQFRNEDGTYNGVKLFASLTGLSEAEIKWTFERMEHLLKVEGKSKEETKQIMCEEAKSKPWEAK